MTEPEASTKNTAENGSTVGIQASSVHHSTVYIVQPDASPQEKYRVGVSYLNDGLPGEARKLINEAMANNHDNGEVRFHWALATLSKRSYRDLNTEERDRLKRLSDVLPGYVDDEWKRALAAICALLENLQEPGTDPGPALDELGALPPKQNAMIVRHLDLVLTGGMKDRLWSETRHAAEHARFDNDRLNRAWAYFHPNPAGPRAQVPTNDTTLGVWLRSFAWSAVFMTAFARIVWSALSGGTPLLILTLLLALATGYIAARTGLEWHYKTAQFSAKERVHANRHRMDRAPESGFANRVHHSFSYYSYKYSPEGADRERWLAETAGIRSTLRDEVTNLYHDGKTEIDEVNWLIRHLVASIRDQWKNGILHDYRKLCSIPLATKVLCSLSVATAASSVLSLIIAAIRAHPLVSTFATPVVLISGWCACLGWLHILCNRRRLTEDRREHQQLQAERTAAYRKWKEKLDTLRPSESEMEDWLDSDKKLFLNDALLNYRLAWRDIIAYTFLQAPAKYYKRARVNGGPWRHSKYDLRLFLITHDGVREVGTELDFQKSSRNGQERNNFRFDAVSSVQVTINNESSYFLEFTLMNGPARSMRIIDATPDSTGNLDNLSELNLDAAGFTHALHVLEGIAAEGKSWISRDGATTTP